MVSFLGIQSIELVFIFWVFVFDFDISFKLFIDHK